MVLSCPFSSPPGSDGSLCLNDTVNAAWVISRQPFGGHARLRPFGRGAGIGPRRLSLQRGEKTSWSIARPDKAPAHPAAGLTFCPPNGLHTPQARPCTVETLGPNGSCAAPTSPLFGGNMKRISSLLVAPVFVAAVVVGGTSLPAYADDAPALSDLDRVNLVRDAHG